MRVKVRAVVALVPLGIAVVAVGIAAFAARTVGPPYFGTEPVVVASLGVGALATAAIGHATWRNDRAVGLTIVLGAWSLVAYLVVLSLASLTHAIPGQDLIVGTAARLAIGGHIPPLTLFVMTGLLARRRLLAERAIGWPLLVTASLAAVLYGATFTFAHPSTPFPDVSPIVDHLPPPVLAGAMSLSLVWLATLLLPPVLLIWARRGAPRADSGRLATAAVASFVPVCQILLCTLLGFAVEASGISQQGGAVVLLVGLGAAWPLTAVGYGLAVRGRGAPYTVSTGVLARAGSLVLGLITAMIAICAGLLISFGRGLGTTLAIAIAVLVVAIALRPLAVRVLAAVIGETVQPGESVAIDSAANGAGSNGDLGVSAVPARRQTSRLAALSGREREVLWLLATGLSNAGIAAELVLSERTIDAHLRSVFGKLDLPDSKHDNRRVQAATLWAQESHAPD
ncbi:MAG: helix-turn-helix transcriptional regulator [Candidatus Dormiibacterota bacterium]